MGDCVDMFKTFAKIGNKGGRALTNTETGRYKARKIVMF